MLAALLLASALAQGGSLLIALIAVVALLFMLGGAFTNFLEAAVLNHLRGVAYSAPAALYVGLSTTAPTEAGGNITEPAGGWYARQAATFGAASAGDPTSMSNSAEVDFGDPTEDLTISHFFIADAAAAGNVLVVQALDAPVQVQAGVQEALKFDVGDLSVTLD